MEQAGQILELALDDYEVIRLVWCPPGEFPMGNLPSELHPYNPVVAQHRVELTKGFWLGATPITESQWKKIVGQPSRLASRRSNTNQLPAQGIDWNEAHIYCQLLTELWKSKNIITDEQKVELPSEAQWEYACRANTHTPWFFGNDQTKLELYGWYVKNSDDKAHPVGLNLANPWGLYDLYGNVAEWCMDDLNLYKGGSESELQINPLYLKDSPVMKIVRGGAYDHLAEECTSYSRETINLGNLFNEATGLRILLSA